MNYYQNQTTAMLKRWVGISIPQYFGVSSAEISFMVDVRDGTKAGFPVIGRYSTMKEAYESDEHIFWLTHSPKGVYGRDIVMVVTLPDRTVDFVKCQSKRECYIKALEKCDKVRRSKHR